LLPKQDMPPLLLIRPTTAPISIVWDRGQSPNSPMLTRNHDLKISDLPHMSARALRVRQVVVPLERYPTCPTFSLDASCVTARKHDGSAILVIQRGTFEHGSAEKLEGSLSGQLPCFGGKLVIRTVRFRLQLREVSTQTQIRFHDSNQAPSPRTTA